MVLDFALLPPEINSGLMYAGAGSAPLMAASTAWSNLAAELSTTATQYESIITSLTTEQWTGAGSMAAAAAAQPFVAWLTQTAGAAEEAGAQAMASAAAYEAAFTATVPPPVVAANQAQLAALVASNILGQNTPAILATEAQYAEMWVQDATAMYTYAAAATTSSALQPLTPATPNTNPAAPGVQAAAASASNANSTATAAASPLAGLGSIFTAGSVVPFGEQLFQSLPQGVQDFLNAVDGLGGTLFNFNFVQQIGVTAAWFVGNTIPTVASYAHTVWAAGTAAPAAAAAADAVTPAAGAALGRKPRWWARRRRSAAWAQRWARQGLSAACRCRRAGPRPPRQRWLRPTRRSGAAAGPLPRTRPGRSRRCPGCRVRPRPPRAPVRTVPARGTGSSRSSCPSRLVCDTERPRHAMANGSSCHLQTGRRVMPKKRRDISRD